MCGIAGAYQQVDGEAATKTMGRRLDHRGPDEEGSFSYCDDRVDVHFADFRSSIFSMVNNLS
jgi:asparagine synthetase B (glutamine-hydrolysing)